MRLKDVLLHFATSVDDLTSALNGDASLADDEKLSLENNLLRLQMTYVRWKARKELGRRVIDGMPVLDELVQKKPTRTKQQRRPSSEDKSD
jgi:hypothetical protein